MSEATANATEVRAPIQPSYRVRLLVIGLIMLVFGGYFAYDGWIGYPEKNKQYEAYSALQEDTTVADPQEAYRAIADENGWPTKTPEKGKSPTDIMTQKIIFVILSIVGAWFLFGWITAGGRYTFMNEEGVGDHKGKFAKWDDIKDLDLRRWDAKGIALVSYSGGRIVLDDWKMATDETRAMIDTLREKLGMEPEKPAVEEAIEEEVSSEDSESAEEPTEQTA